MARTNRGVEDDPAGSVDVPPEYHPEDNKAGVPAEVVVLTSADLTARQATRFAEDEYRRSPAGWRDRIKPLMTDKTLVVVASFAEAHGTKYGADTNTALFHVDEPIAGPASAPDIEVVQAADGGAPLSCGGLFWHSGMTAALVLEPLAEAGAYGILSGESDDTIGWAVQTGPGSFESYADVLVDQATLATLGVAP